MNKFSLLLAGFVGAVALSSGAFAQHAGGGGGHASGGGGHVGGGGAHAVAGHGGYAGYRGGYGGAGYRGGYYGGYHGGYYGGYHGGYGYGWRGGWGCCGWGWGWGGLAAGLYFASLPLYYNTYYWDGIPYYYADNTYYVYDPNVRQYETVAPPAGLENQEGAAGGAPPGGGAPADLIVYPKNGQTPDQVAKDRFECHQWAAGQTGYDPTQGSTAPAAKRPDYMRAQAACLDGRGYSVN